MEDKDDEENPPVSKAIYSDPQYESLHADNTSYNDDSYFDQFEVDESPCTSMEPDADPSMYGFDAAAMNRVQKREKIRNQGRNTNSKVKLTYKDAQKMKPSKKGSSSSIKEMYDPSELKQGISTGVEGDEGTDKKSTFKKKEKSQRRTRSYERDLKKATGDFHRDSLPATPVPPVIPKRGSMLSVKIDSPNRFMSLYSKPVPAGNLRHFTRRQHSSHVEECPKDRVDFHKLFSTLINLGTKASVEKDKKSYARQLSSEQEIWQNKYNDLIWLELQAWHTGRTMSEMDKYLLTEREKVESTLKTILKYKFHRPHTSIDQDSSQRIPKTLAQYKLAMKEVVELLNQLEKLERLFPTTKALGKESDLYSSLEFIHRMNSLCVWLNISKDLKSTFETMTKVLGIQEHHQLKWQWLGVAKLDETSKEAELSPEDSLESSTSSESESDTECEDTESAFDNGGDDDNESGDKTIDDHSDNGDNNEEDTDKSDVTKVQELEVNINGGTKTAKSVRFIVTSDDDQSPSPGSSSVSERNLFLGAQTSTPIKSGSQSGSSDSLSRESSDISIDEKLRSRTSIYRPFADKSLKKMGLRKLLLRLRDLLDKSLQRAKQALERDGGTRKPVDTQVSLDDEAIPSVISPSWDLSPELVSLMKTKDRRSSLIMHGAWSEEFAAIGLPSFRPAYLFLVRIPLDVIHECLRLRLEQRPVEQEPSILSIGQLIRECTEVIKAAVLVKQYFRYMVSAVMWDDIHAEEKFEMDLQDFDADMKQMMEVYFSYLQVWMCSLQNHPEASRVLRNALEEHWTFTKEICPHIVGGEAEAGKRFSYMASSLLNSIADFLETGIDDCIHHYDTTVVESTEDEDDYYIPHNRSVELRQSIIKICRDFKNLFHEARERAMKALGVAKMLRKDLEIAADFNIMVNTQVLLDKLKETNHIKVATPNTTGNTMLKFIPYHICKEKEQILHLLNVTCGREDFHSTETQGQEGYLLLMGGDIENVVWEGESITVEPTAETTVALSHVEVEGLLLVVIKSSHLSNQRKDFELNMEGVVELVNEQTSCHQAIAESLAELKCTALDLREKITKAIGQVDEKLNLDDISEMDEIEKVNVLKLYRETMHQCYNFGFEYHKEVTRLITSDARDKLAKGLISFAEQWMKFVTEKCERGRGVRPRWANQGLDFLIVACEPRVLAGLTDEEFKDLKFTINNCISHVIGSKDHDGTPGTPTYRTSSPVPDAQRMAMFRNLSCPDPPKIIPRTRSAASEPPTPFLHQISDPSFGVKFPGVHHEVDGEDKESEKEDSYEEHYATPMERVHGAIKRLEEQRQEKLTKARVIGKVTSQRLDTTSHIHIRRVNFKWQRGNKIGEGQFGKVYTAVNCDTGELMAMKEIGFQPNDHKSIRDIADEINNFEGISHPSLVKYYGVEVHREEMLIFMEYCNLGTIEEAAKAGLTEPLIRKYTKEILIAITVLHDNGIVHRDIKGANIFLQSKGPLKLGDFGCSVKLKNHTTMPGEINTLVGTTAFMAPEVITHNDGEGHGRAADIWSLGCVVIEMATGKRPWHEFENNFQIMFKVGMGGTPTIPDTLSDEGKDFLAHCFIHSAIDRWTASQLQDHPFTKVSFDDDTEQGSSAE